MQTPSKPRARPTLSDGRRVRRAVILQSAYIPWKGYFDLMSHADVFVLYDSAAFSKNHWHNRNRIKRPSGNSWLTVPVRTAGRLGQPLQDIETLPGWASRHWNLICEAYGRQPAFETEAPWLRALYEEADREPLLTRINERFLNAFATRLGIAVEVLRHSRTGPGTPTGRLVDICLSLGATHYLSGPSSANYLEVPLFEEAGIILEWMRYGPYPTYQQPHGAFDHAVSLVDPIFCLGPSLSERLFEGGQTSSREQNSRA